MADIRQQFDQLPVSPQHKETTWGKPLDIVPLSQKEKGAKYPMMKGTVITGYEVVTDVQKGSDGKVLSYKANRLDPSEKQITSSLEANWDSNGLTSVTVKDANGKPLEIVKRTAGDMQVFYERFNDFNDKGSSLKQERLLVDGTMVVRNIRNFDEKENRIYYYHQLVDGNGKPTDGAYEEKHKFDDKNRVVVKDTDDTTLSEDEEEIVHTEITYNGIKKEIKKRESVVIKSDKKELVRREKRAIYENPDSFEYGVNGLDAENSEKDFLLYEGTEEYKDAKKSVVEFFVEKDFFNKAKVEIKAKDNVPVKYTEFKYKGLNKIVGGDVYDLAAGKKTAFERRDSGIMAWDLYNSTPLEPDAISEMRNRLTKKVADLRKKYKVNEPIIVAKSGVTGI